MNEIEHLLVCLLEECSEVQKDVSKALRFGLDDVNPDTGIKNAKAIADELKDVIAIMQMLEDRGAIDTPENIVAQIIIKKVKVAKYMRYAREKGTLLDVKT